MLAARVGQSAGEEGGASAASSSQPMPPPSSSPREGASNAAMTEDHYGRFILRLHTLRDAALLQGSFAGDIGCDTAVDSPPHGVPIGIVNALLDEIIPTLKLIVRVLSDYLRDFLPRDSHCADEANATNEGLEEAAANNGHDEGSSPLLQRLAWDLEPLIQDESDHQWPDRLGPLWTVAAVENIFLVLHLNSLRFNPSK